MLKYGIYAKAIEWMCFKPALTKLSTIYPEMDMKRYKKSVKREYKAMLLRTPDISGSSLEVNLYIAAFVFPYIKQSQTKSIPMLSMKWYRPFSTLLSWYAYTKIRNVRYLPMRYRTKK